LEYCIQAVGPHTAADKLCLEKVQMRAVNMVSNIGKGSYTEKLVMLKLTTLEERRWRGDMIQTWRIMSGKDRVSVGTWFDLEVDRSREGQPPLGMPGGTMPSGPGITSMKTGGTYSATELSKTIMHSQTM
jgi:hypothetical protein